MKRIKMADRDKFVVDTGYVCYGFPECTRVRAYRADDDTVAWFLVPSQEYSAGWEYFVIDEARHRRLNPAIPMPDIARKYPGAARVDAALLSEEALATAHAAGTLTPSALQPVRADLAKKWQVGGGEAITLRELLATNPVILDADVHSLRLRYWVQFVDTDWDSADGATVSRATFEYLVSVGVPSQYTEYAAAHTNRRLAELVVKDALERLGSPDEVYKEYQRDRLTTARRRLALAESRLSTAVAAYEAEHGDANERERRRVEALREWERSAAA